MVSKLSFNVAGNDVLLLIILCQNMTEYKYQSDVTDNKTFKTQNVISGCRLYLMRLGGEKRFIMLQTLFLFLSRWFSKYLTEQVSAKTNLWVF